MDSSVEEQDELDLPPGFRFHPTDEELIHHYLFHKVMDTNFSCRAIADVDLNKSEPWDLPWKAKLGEKEWYFFCVRDRKYPTGLRTNRATEAGYWKATGKDKEIYRGKSLVGMKKTLVFYRGRAPKGDKSNWVIHEFRLEGKLSAFYLPKSAKNEWVICRLFHKNSNEKKLDISAISKSAYSGNEFLNSILKEETKHSVSSLKNVPCFSTAMDSQKKLLNFASFFNPIDSFSKNPLPISPNQAFSVSPNPQFPCSVLFQEEQPRFRALVQNVYGGNPIESEKEKLKFSRETCRTADINDEISSVFSNLEMGCRPFDNSDVAPAGSVAAIDLDGFWNY